MNTIDYRALLPFMIVAGTTVTAMLAIAFRRSHRLTLAITLAGLVCAAVSLVPAWAEAPQQVTRLLLVDRYALYFTGLILFAAMAVAGLAWSYLGLRSDHPEEFYLLLLLATLGASVLAASVHFASLFLGVEILSVALYALAGYLRQRDESIEAGVKYLILAALSSSFILFGMALMYADTGSMEFSALALRTAEESVPGLLFIAGTVLMVAGLGFKLAVVPFHLWTPDVYQGAPAPVAAFIATVSKGAVFSLVMRFFTPLEHGHGSLVLILAVVAAASMFIGNLLALLQENVKRLLAYSSISHLGYLLVALVAVGPSRVPAAGFYLAAYFITTLGAFGVITVLSTRERDADRIDDYLGLAWRRPALGGVFTAMLLSLAGIPLTAGFVAKFYLVAAGVGSALWLLVVVLVINSAIGLYYYLRIVIVLYSREYGTGQPARPLSASGGSVLGALAVALVWLGVYPAPLLAIMTMMTPR